MIIFFSFLSTLSSSLSAEVSKKKTKNYHSAKTLVKFDSKIILKEKFGHNVVDY